MKKVIRERATGSFLTKSGEWTEEVTKAWPFENVAQALRARHQFNLQNVELYFFISEDQRGHAWDFAVPLDDPSPGDDRSGDNSGCKIFDGDGSKRNAAKAAGAANKQN
jgi:hypothetical protein